MYGSAGSPVRASSAALFKSSGAAARARADGGPIARRNSRPPTLFITMPLSINTIDTLLSAPLTFHPSHTPHTTRTQTQHTRTQTQQTQTAPTAKLEHVAERFSAFYTDLEQERQQRRVAEASRHQALAEAVARLEKALEAEVKRRSEADRQMQAHFEDELKAAADRSAAQFAELSSSFRTGLEGLARTLQDLHAVVKCALGPFNLLLLLFCAPLPPLIRPCHCGCRPIFAPVPRAHPHKHTPFLPLTSTNREEREQRRQDVEHLAATLVGKVNECVGALDEGERFG